VREKRRSEVKLPPCQGRHEGDVKGGVQGVTLVHVRLSRVGHATLSGQQVSRPHHHYGPAMMHTSSGALCLPHFLLIRAWCADRTVGMDSQAASG
jgi:hypothetical protein